ncbi:AAA family ATPase [Cylindrospermopsis raciborskii CHAB3438]|uniref:AAA family ATPase n=1 Tax=Cylindrospermopsis raciborskii TaxID=77022 RepID=UPI001F0FF624|nr:ATP-binding protein [Cylindrospermopsis raciborskii]MCH4904910.1 AAA family ATPase [Cylindrospermopsis raciborskii CHAB3438]MEB3145689.1 ATP-binding protein [Cylindrospermopsis raciborskii]
MTHINDIIKRQTNPFDSIQIKPTDFWVEEQDSTVMVDSIHQEAIKEIESLLELVAKDHRSRTVLIRGSSGSGKSYLLGRLKRKLNSKAFFAYVFCNWSSSAEIWRHILRRTVDSLLQIPEGEQESQLMLWLKSLSAFTKSGVKQKIFNTNFWQLLRGDRPKFIKHLKSTYKKGIYHPDIFFGVLHDLTNPDLYDLACEWLRGDDLSEESMKLIKVKSCIDTEEAAKNILANFGKISTQTQPIVLCFDNLDTMPQQPGGTLEIQPFMNVNTTIHGDNLKNFLVIISVISDTWERNRDSILPADKAGIEKQIRLQNISIEQAEALWICQLKPLHRLAYPIPESPLFPLSREILDRNYPGGKSTPRSTLVLGRKEYQEYKLSLNGNYSAAQEELSPQKTVVDDSSQNQKVAVKGQNGTFSANQDINQSEFELLWQQEYKKSQQKYSKISLLSSSDLTQMLIYAICAMDVPEIQPKLISGKYTTHSFSYLHPQNNQKTGVVWTEEHNMNSFYHIMSACQTAIQKKACETLYLIRSGNVGNPESSGNQIYRQIFVNTHNLHIRSSLTGIHFLATYQSLVNSAKSQDLLIGGKTVDLRKLEDFVQRSKVLHGCDLLQALGIVSKTSNPHTSENREENLEVVKGFLFNLVKINQCIAVKTAIDNTLKEFQFPETQTASVQNLIDLLYQEKKVKILGSTSKPEEQIILWCPDFS